MAEHPLCPHCGKKHPKQEQIEEALLVDAFDKRAYNVTITMRELAFIAHASKALMLLDPRFDDLGEKIVKNLSTQMQMEK